MGAIDHEQIETERQSVIQRCTQRWNGCDLDYEDFPTPEGRMTRDLMLSVLERVSRENPNDEFRGHRAVLNRRYQGSEEGNRNCCAPLPSGSRKGE